MDAREDFDLDDIRRRLEAEREGLHAIDALSAEARRPVELDQAAVGRLSRMDALQVQAMAKAVGARRHGRVQRIEAALRRLDEDDYGFCTACGGEIPAKRLELDLSIERCVGCAA